jgi:hypothetical protein
MNQRLPRELQLSIFSHLPLADLLACSLTSKEMNNTCHKNELWEALFKEYNTSNNLYEEVSKQFTNEDSRFWNTQFVENYNGLGCV